LFVFLKKAAFISMLLQFNDITINILVTVKLHFQHHYSSLQCHMIIQMIWHPRNISHSQFQH